MSSQNLERLAAARQLKAEPPARKEFEGLLRLGQIRLKDARNPGLSLEGRFDLGYSAAHALSLAALRWHGYRVDERLMAELIGVTDGLLEKVLALPLPK